MVSGRQYNMERPGLPPRDPRDAQYSNQHQLHRKIADQAKMQSNRNYADQHGKNSSEPAPLNRINGPRPNDFRMYEHKTPSKIGVMHAIDSSAAGVNRRIGQSANVPHQLQRANVNPVWWG